MPVATIMAVLLIFAPLDGSGQSAATESLLELWGDESVFSAEFFPEAEQTGFDDIFLAGLETLFPRRVARERPDVSPGPPRVPRVESFIPGVRYVRVYHLGEALETIRNELANNALVLDLRNVPAGPEETLDLGNILAVNDKVKLALFEHTADGDADRPQRELMIEPVGIRRSLQPAFILTNGETAGPLEALLAELKNNGQIISIGLPGAGLTGEFRRAHDDPSLYVLSGEWRPASGESLLDGGFTPSVQLNVTAADDQRAYEAMENGRSLLSLVAADPEPAGDAESPMDALDSLDLENAEPGVNNGPIDPILQRAYFIATALRSMGKIASPENN